MKNLGYVNSVYSFSISVVLDHFLFDFDIFLRVLLCLYFLHFSFFAIACPALIFTASSCSLSVSSFSCSLCFTAGHLLPSHPIPSILLCPINLLNVLLHYTDELTLRPSSGRPQIPQIILNLEVINAIKSKL